MKTIDLTPYQSDSPILSALKPFQAILKHGFSWYQSRRSQEELISALDDVLSDECVLLRNVNLPRIGTPIPLILLAPAGITVINPKNKSGYYRAEGKKWEVMGRGEEYQTAPNNLIRETWVYQKTVEGYLKKHKFKAPNLKGALIFISPETHVESISPIVKVLRADGIKNFARQIAIAKPAFSDLDFKNVVKLLTHPRLPKGESKPSKPQEEASPQPEAQETQLEQTLNSLIASVNFDQREWIIIGILLILVIIVLIALITLIILTV